MKHIENNKLIAEFMNRKMRKGNFWSKVMGYADEYIIINGEPKWSLGDIPYNSSWNWLMPVVKKITNLIKNNRPLPLELDDKWELQWRKLYDYQSYSFFENNITSIYKAVIEFIKWYNLQKEI